MTSKRKTRSDLQMLAKAFSNCIDDTMPWPMARAIFGGDLLKKARQKGIVVMDPDPHDGRTSKTVGQRIKQMLPGGGIKHGVATNVRYGSNVVPETVALTDAGRQMLVRNR